jgi:branched-chain amino acid transport system substrate-binding protein
MLAVVASLGAALPAGAQDKGTLKIGGLATLEGVFAVPGQDSMRGIEAALKEANYQAGGYKLDFIKGSSDASPDSALRAARKLVEQDGVAILVGPLSGSEGLALKDYAKTQSGTTFINGTSAAQDTTLRDPAPNFFRFWTEGAQWMYGLGDYLLKDKGWKKVATIGEDYSFMHTQFFGFALPYCEGGGKIVERFWVPLGTKDYSSIIAALPWEGRCA